MAEPKQFYESANRLVVDTREAEFWDNDQTVVISPEESEVAIQSLPMDVDEWLRIDFVVPQESTTFMVYREDPLTYHFHMTHLKIGSTFRLNSGEYVSGWYHPPKPYVTDTEVISIMIRMLIWFFNEVEKRRLYPFITNPTQDPNKVKNPSKRKKLEEQTNVIVYLGRPPGKYNKTPTDKTPREFGFPRRQHRRTLRAERFKNHPKYGVYKGVLVTQSWCGPKEYVHRRKVYRLWEPPAIDTTG